MTEATKSITHDKQVDYRNEVRNVDLPLPAFPSVGRETGRPDCPATLPANDGFELLSEGGIVLSVDTVEIPPSEIPSAAAAKSLAVESGLGNCGEVFEALMTRKSGLKLNGHY